MLEALESPPTGTAPFFWADFAEMRALIHPDRCFSRGDLSGLERRGRDTVHVKWDQNAAILAGDVMMGMAMRLLMRSAHHAPRPLDVIDAFSTGLIEVCDGQALDLAFMERDDVTPQEYFKNTLSVSNVFFKYDLRLLNIRSFK